MRILLLSANTGEGHNSTAKAIMEALEEQQVSCVLRDSLAYLSPGFSKFISNWHVRIYRYGGKLFDMGYRMMESSTLPEEMAPIYDLLALGANKLYDTLMTGDFDAVICTHPFSGMMLTEVRRRWGIGVPSFLVATDYTCSPTVEQSSLDGYFIPDARLAEEFVRAGLPEDKLISTGIPVRQSFYRKTDRRAARAFLDLPEQGTVALLMCGSMGAGPIRRIAKELAEQLKGDDLLVAICGSNERLRESLQELQLPRLRVLGYTTQVSEYMDGADLIITKPGGISVTEAANKQLPMVLINSVGGCENGNFSFFLENGLALGSTEAEQVIALAGQLIADEAQRLQIRQRLQQQFTGNGGQELARYVTEAGLAYRQTQKGILSAETVHPIPEKGGIPMETTEKQTLLNLARSFAGEAQARLRYTVYAQVARKEGLEWIARIFEETADNEAVHGEEFLEQLQALGGCAPEINPDAGYPFQLGNTVENLAFAAQGELHEHDSAYPQFAELARREGLDDAARLWLQIARVEGVHHNTFRQLHQQMASGTLMEKNEPITWRCLNCGYTYDSIRPCDPCPVCGKSAGWQEGQLDKKMMIAKK